MASPRHPLPALSELLDTAQVLSVPMAIRFRGLASRQCVLVQGPSGWAEFGPFPEYDDEEAATWLAAAIEAGWGQWGESAQPRVQVNAPVPAVPPEMVPEVLARFPGCTTAKVKVAERGQSLADDIARVLAVREAMGGAAHVRVDANGGWDVVAALAGLESLAALELQYAEQPCATVGELVRLRHELDRRGVPVALAADESIRRARDPHLVAASGAISYVVLKVAPLGGVTQAVSIGRELSARYGVRTVVSSALETSVGMAAGVSAAAILAAEAGGEDASGAPLAAGLATVPLMGAYVVADPAVPENGSLPVRRYTPEPALLAAVRADPSTRQWWLDRITRCYQVLTQAPRGGSIPRQMSP